MDIASFFCPTCRRFVGERDECVHCGWTRPPQPGPVGQIRWTAQVSDNEPLPGAPPFPAQIASHDRLAFWPTEDGEVVALDVEAGQIAWRRALRPDRTLRAQAVAVWEATVLIGAENVAELPTHDRALLVWDAATGEELWRYPTRGDCLSAPTVYGDIAYFASSEPRLYALDLAAREVRWAVPALTWSPDAPLVTDAVIVVPARGPVVAAYAPETGARVWTFKADDPDTEWLNLRPAASKETVYLAGWGKRLYAVDLLTGALRWRFEAERGITCPPTSAGDKVLVAVKDYRYVEGKRKGGYGLYALNAADGAIAWQFPTDKHIQIPPVVADDLVLCGADDRSLHALALADGREVWRAALGGRPHAGPRVIGEAVIVGLQDGAAVAIQWKAAPPPLPDPQALLAAGAPLEAAAALALREEYAASAALFAEHEHLSYAAALYLEANELAAAAGIYARLHDFDAALNLYRQTGDRRGEAEILALQGKHAEAAAVYEAIGDVERAANEYVAAGRAGHAARLLRTIKRWAEAAHLYHTLDQDDKAAEILVEAGQHAEAAEIYQRLGKLDTAANVLSQGGLLAEAAALNEQCGHLALAAEQYLQIDQLDRALALYETAGEWKRVAELAEDNADWPRMAEALLKLGQTARAAQIYERASQPERALDLYEKAQQWDKVKTLAGALTQWERQARALERLDWMSQAGEAYQHAAEALPPTVENAPELARLYEAAARCYAEDDDQQRRQRCEDKVREYRCLPNLRGRFECDGVFYEGELTRVALTLKNVGRGAARQVMVQDVSSRFTPDFSRSQTPTLSRLGIEQERALELWLKPAPDALGDARLRVTVGYQDQTGQAYEETFTTSVRVYGRDEKIAAIGAQSPLGVTPRSITPPGVTPSSGATPTRGWTPDAGAEGRPSADDFADLQIRIFPRDETGYLVEMALNVGNVFPRGYADAELDAWAPGHDPTVSGQQLFDLLFADRVLRENWVEARGHSRRRRIRLWLDLDARELHALPWELLHDGRTLLAANAETPFSRYLPIAREWGSALQTRPVRVLAAISNPDDLSEHGLSPLDVETERQTLQNACASLPLSDFSISFLDPPITLERLENALQSGYHILHYVGHGKFDPKKQKASLVLQDEAGNAAMVAEDTLAGMLERQRTRLRLIVLVACQSAARATSDAFLGLAPQLVAIGVPAVLAMQDNVSIVSARKFSATFYQRLLEHGQVDVAANQARSRLLTTDRPDAAVPVLFMRLKSGRLWE